MRIRLCCIYVYFCGNQSLLTFAIDSFMDNTMLIQITNKKAVKLIHELEELNLIKVLNENLPSRSGKLSGKYKGIINKEQAKELNEHIKQMRSEWNNI